jgi:outer membrane protein assembly factor BamA
MTVLKKILFYCFISLCVTASSFAQNIDRTSDITIRLPAGATDSSAKIMVNQINLSGNSITKSYIIYREVQFRNGDSITIAQLAEQLRRVREQVYNTTLFSDVKIETIAVSDKAIDINITVKERWYFFPIPVFQIADRNLNEWIVKYHTSLERTNYGIKLTHYNLTGRKDQLRLYLIDGYTRTISLAYSLPYINQSLTKGLFLSGGFSESKQLIYNTSYNNKALYFSGPKYATQSWAFNASYILRKNIRSRQYFNIGYTYTSVTDSVITSVYNPNYFKDSVTSKSMLDLSYIYQYTNVNNVGFPLEGTTASATVFKRGLGLTGGINLFSVGGTYNKYWNLHRGWYVSEQTQAKIKLPFDEAYINQQALGYGETYLRGQEYYVVDGVAFGLARTTLKKKLFVVSFPFPVKSIAQRIPFAVFAKTYVDMGYSYIPKKFDTYFNNRFLYTYGVGMDILTFYDLNLRLEYSIDQLNEKGLFLHIQKGL